jgi:chromatin assembly factor 1 subunit A
MERFNPERTIDFNESGEKPVAISDFPPPPARRSPNMSVRDIMELLQGTAKNPICLTGEINLSHLRAMEMLQDVEVKYIHFHENVRPPYYGTWSKPLSRLQWRQLAVNPRSKVEILDYDYDSEAEWEEPEEGEDIRSQGEEEEDEIDGGDDLEGFVVEDSLLPKRSLFANDMVPICTGLQWEDPKGTLHPSDISGVKVDFDELRIGFLLGACQTLTPPVHLPNCSPAPEPETVDPFSTEYWAPASVQEPSPAKKVLQRQALTDKTAQVNVPHPPTKQLKAARHVPTEDVEAFKSAVVGQDLTKVAMIEHLKKLFVPWILLDVD